MFVQYIASKISIRGHARDSLHLRSKRRHCVKKDVSWSGNPTIRTRILWEYGQIREYHVPWNATCPPRVRNRIFPDSDFFRGKENRVSGHLLETRRVKTRKLSYSSRFVTNNDVPQASTIDQVEHFYSHPVLFMGFWPKFHGSTSITGVRYPKFHGTWRVNIGYFMVREVSLKFHFRIFHGTWSVIWDSHFGYSTVREVSFGIPLSDISWYVNCTRDSPIGCFTKRKVV